jgi:hypothetical protein
MKGRQGLLATGVLAVLAMLTLLVLVNGAGASPLPFASSPPDAREVQHSALQEVVFFNSGWLDIAPGEVITIEHNYGGDPDLYAVDVWFRDVDVGLGINHKAFGGMAFGEMYWGLAWQRLTASSIELYRFANDVFADQVLVRIWVPDPAPLWDSGWIDINPGDVMTLTHGLGGDINDYTVAMRFKDACPEGVGVNLHAAGGLEDMGLRYGAAWQALTPTTIQALRFRDDVFADQVRLQIYDPNPPTYNSEWQPIEPGEDLTLMHNLGGNRMTYIVRVFARDVQPDGHGPNTLYGGGFEATGRFFGSNWQELTNTSITIHRERDDDMAHSADEVRVWIYAPRYIYLPTVMNNYPTPD